jgi:3-methyladenine DNA glycosylase AlkD
MFQEIVSTYQAHANPEVAEGMEAYLRNQFKCYGIKTPLRREISKPFLKEVKSLPKKEVLSLVKRLWRSPQRELHYMAQELLVKVSAQHISNREDILFLEFLILNNSWWDTVDVVAPKLVKTYFEKFPDERDVKVEEWIKSENIWLQRTALLFQLKHKEAVDLPFMFKTILKLKDTKEFFVDKAIGWLLREYSKKRKEEIRQFIDEHGSKLSNLSIREGSKYL